MIARSALTMATKNHIIVDAIGAGNAFDPAKVALFVENELHDLAGEQADYARRMSASAASASRARGPARHDHDYRAEDRGALMLRREIYAALSDRLVALANDEEFIGATVERARRDAWDEIADTIASRLDRESAIASDPDYDTARKKRMREVRKTDLPALRKAHRRSR
jgi:hypothetical protein